MPHQGASLDGLGVGSVYPKTRICRETFDWETPIASCLRGERMSLYEPLGVAPVLVPIVGYELPFL